jgi:hypothetical protein
MKPAVGGLVLGGGTERTFKRPKRQKAGKGTVWHLVVVAARKLSPSKRVAWILSQNLEAWT